MNTKKKEIIDKISAHYDSNGEHSIVLYEDKGLNAQQTKIIRQNIWSLGDMFCIKNTLFEKFLKERKFEEGKDLHGNNIAIFCKDPFSVISTINKNARKLKTDKKFSLKGAFINQHYFHEEKTKEFKAYTSINDLKTRLYMALQYPLMSCVTVLNLASESKR